ncbi:Z1 domain-containing protein [Pontibacter mucosus]|uniref:Z1 domain-containing protein n=1 Tax=Pontibacter mucosus TaxID=1649266 RepID=A0A2T5YDV2_9BACT|nr:Z1 domain-containing protein [Pontibacter mucosus]PTX14726.1 Z1 domain-containing protein [Pontibacter mucosus]
MIEQAKQIGITLLQAKKNVTDSDLKDAVENVLKIFPGLAGECDFLYKYLESQFSVFSDNYKILIDDKTYTPWLKNKKSEIRWNFWNRYVMYLQRKIAPSTLNKLDNLTDDILDRIIDPTTPGPWDKRGMVVGQVQSGKTGNYIGLINKAADAGFKLIIVLAGMHDSLRSQTQIRVDEGFLGFNTQTAMNFSNAGNRIGVGQFNKNLPAHALTTSRINGDFRGPAAQASGVNIRGTDPIILVVKKNASILKNLVSWLAVRGDKTPDGNIIIRDLPFLLIDDEADNASVNVNPSTVSTINGCIRALLALFEQSAYVGYTATPFANIFIPLLNEEQTKGLNLNIKDFEFSVGQDLFPRDFIINIPAPSNYIGPSKVFGLPASSSSETSEEPLPVVTQISDYHSFVPDKHKKGVGLPEVLPESLKYAIKSFLLSCAARRVRKQINVHNSMLIHVSRYIDWQDRIASLVDEELKSYQRQLEFNQGTILKDLKKIWKEDFEPKTNQILNQTHTFYDPEIKPIPWAKVEKELFNASSKVEVRAVHGDKNIAGLTYHNISPLDYFLSEQQGNYLSVIAVGGDKLSRGLTLEGLTTSYYLRASKMYDTLMQMGRWFGYRPGYADLCRLFTSRELIEWFEHITIASEEMRAEFDYMFLLNETPRNYGLKVRTHPGVLKITAANKFRHKQIMMLSYSGELEQTYRFKVDQRLFQNNFDAATQLIAALGKPGGPVNKLLENQQYVWQGINNSNLITQFLGAYSIGREVLDVHKMADYINAQVRSNNLVNWTVVLVNNTTAKKEDAWHFEINGMDTEIGLTDRSITLTHPEEIVSSYSINKAMIISPNHEMIDLSDQRISHALALTKMDWQKEEKKKEPVLPSGARVRYTRAASNGLLILYPLHYSPNHRWPEPGAPDQKDFKSERRTLSDVPIIGFAVSFPEIADDEKIEYAVNKQFIDEFDYPDELDAEDGGNE